MKNNYTREYGYTPYDDSRIDCQVLLEDQFILRDLVEHVAWFSA